jgi:hypothetical protein
MMFRFNRYLKAALPALAVAWTACDLSVTNPGPLADEELNAPANMPGLVVGMSADLSVALGDQSYFSALLADELAHYGNYNNERHFFRGEVLAENTNVVWANMHRARWVAENGIERMRTVLKADFATSPLVARAYALAGFANRLAGENVCHAVIDGGKAESYTVHFERAEAQFTEAITRAKALKDATLEHAALAGRASVRAALGRWDEAAADAALVPANFRYDAAFSTNSARERNKVFYESRTRSEVTVGGTPWADVVGDPRAPWDTVKAGGKPVVGGIDGKTPLFRQAKYTGDGSAIALAKGTEMLLLRAEAALRKQDVAGAMTLINEGRATDDLPALTAADEDAAWAILRQERAAVLWLEGRRIWDLRRWHEEGRIGEWKQEAGHSKCFVISLNEQMSNKNLK